MLCASGYEFNEKLRLASKDQEAAKRALRRVVVPSPDSARRFEDASRRYDRRLSDFENHKLTCGLCREIS
jgi:hypothetical protein